MDNYSKQPWKSSASPLPIPKMFKMPNISKYDRITDPRNHVIVFTIGAKENDFNKPEIELVLIKKFEETLL